MTVQAINHRSHANRIPKFASMKKIIVISIISMMLLGGGYAYYLYNKPHEGVGDEKPKYNVTASAIVSEYDSDETAANAKYLGKVVEVKGVISEKLKDEKGKIIITLQGEDLSGVGCVFDPKSQSEIAGLHEGQEITVKGRVTGRLMDVELTDCIIINSQTNQ